MKTGKFISSPFVSFSSQSLISKKDFHEIIKPGKHCFPGFIISDALFLPYLTSNNAPFFTYLGGLLFSRPRAVTM